MEIPFGYTSSVSSPSGSTKIWCASRSAKRTTLSSTDGQYRGPVPSMTPVYMGERSRAARMIACVRSPVCVMWHGT